MMPMINLQYSVLAPSIAREILHDSTSIPHDIQNASQLQHAQHLVDRSKWFDAENIQGPSPKCPKTYNYPGMFSVSAF